MEKRVLGRTGHQSTVVAFGTAALGRDTVTQDVADTAVELVLKHGVNHIDIAPSYGHAMERMAPWMPEIRSQVFLGAKTTERTKAEAWQNIRSCMSRLGVDSFDLFQLHSVGIWRPWTRSPAPAVRWRRCLSCGIRVLPAGSVSPGTGRRRRESTWRLFDVSTSTP